MLALSDSTHFAKSLEDVAVDVIRWEEHRSEIEDMFLRQRLTNQQIRERLKKVYQMNVTKHQLEYRMREIWKLRKNMRKDDYLFTQIVATTPEIPFNEVQRPPVYEVYLNGVRQSARKIKKGLWRHKFRQEEKGISQNLLQCYISEGLQVGQMARSGTFNGTPRSPSSTVSHARETDFLWTFIRHTLYIMQNGPYGGKGWEHEILDLIRIRPLQDLFSRIIALDTAASVQLGAVLVTSVLFETKVRYDVELLHILLECKCRPGPDILSLIEHCKDSEKIFLLVNFLPDVYEDAARAVSGGKSALLNAILKDNPRLEAYFNQNRLQKMSDVWAPGALLYFDALKNGHEKVAEIALRGFDPSNSSFLCQAVQAREELAVFRLLEAGADPNMPGAVKLSPESGYALPFSIVSPLSLALLAGSTRIAERLLAAGADPNISNQLVVPEMGQTLSIPLSFTQYLFSEITALEIALLHGLDVKILQLLLNAGAKFPGRHEITWMLALIGTKADSREFNFIVNALVAHSHGFWREFESPTDFYTLFNRVSLPPHRYLQIRRVVNQGCVLFFFAFDAGLERFNARFSIRPWEDPPIPDTSLVLQTIPDICSIIMQDINSSQLPNWGYIFEHLRKINIVESRLIMQSVFESLRSAPFLPHVFRKGVPPVAVILTQEARELGLDIPSHLKALFLQNIIGAAWRGLIDVQDLELDRLLSMIVSSDNAGPWPFGTNDEHPTDQNFLRQINMVLSATPEKHTITYCMNFNGTAKLELTPRSLEVLDYFLSLGWDMNEGTPGARQNSALGILSFLPSNHLQHKAISLLVQSGANTQALCPDGQTVLARAVAKGSHQLARLLLDAGERISLDAYGLDYSYALSMKCTPLQMAARSGDSEMVTMLLEHDADPNTPPHMDGGGTALELAVQMGRTETVNVLLKAGAVVTLRAFELSQQWPNIAEILTCATGLQGTPGYELYSTSLVAY